MAVTIIHAGTEQVMESRSQPPMADLREPVKKKKNSKLKQEAVDDLVAIRTVRTSKYMIKRDAYSDKERVTFLLLYYQCNKLRHYASDCLERLLKLQEDNLKKQMEE